MIELPVQLSAVGVMAVVIAWLLKHVLNSARETRRLLALHEAAQAGARNEFRQALADLGEAHKAAVAELVADAARRNREEIDRLLSVLGRRPALFRAAGGGEPPAAAGPR